MGKPRGKAPCTATVVSLCAASVLRAATYWVAGGADSNWSTAENWSHLLGDGTATNEVPFADNMYIRKAGSVAVVAEDFATTGRLRLERGSQSSQFAIRNNGKTWRSTHDITVGDDTYNAGVSFSGGLFYASQLSLGGVDAHTGYAELADTAMTLSGKAVLNAGRLVLGAGATLEATSVEYGGAANEAALSFEGGRLRCSPASTAVALVAAHGNLAVTVGAAGGTIDSAGRTVLVSAPILDAPGEPGRMTFAGGGKVLLTGAIGWTGGTVVEAGTCVAVTNAAMKDALVSTNLTVFGSDAWLDRTNEVSLLRLDGCHGRIADGDCDKVTFSCGAPAKGAVRISVDRKEMILRARTVRTVTISEGGTTYVSDLMANGTLPKSVSVCDILVVNSTADATFYVNKWIDVAGVVFNVAPGTTLSVARPDKLASECVRVTGGGTLRYNRDTFRLGKAAVEAGSCIVVPGDIGKNALLGRGLTVLNPEGLLDMDGAVPLVNTVSGGFSDSDLGAIRFPGGLRPPLGISSDGKTVQLCVTRHTAVLQPGESKAISALRWSPALSGDVGPGDVLDLDVGGDATLDIDRSVGAGVVRFAVATGGRLTLTGGDVAAAVVDVEGGTVAASNVAKSAGANIARFRRLVGGGTVSAAAGVSFCEIVDASGFTGTLDAGAASGRRVLLEGGVRLYPQSLDTVVVAPGGTATVAADANPLARDEGAIVKGRLVVGAGATLFARESGTASGIRYSLEDGGRLKARFTASGTSPKVQNAAN